MLHGELSSSHKLDRLRTASHVWIENLQKVQVAELIMSVQVISQIREGYERNAAPMSDFHFELSLH